MYRLATFEEVMEEKIGLLLILIAISMAVFNAIHGQPFFVLAMGLIIIAETSSVGIRTDRIEENIYQNIFSFSLSFSALLIVLTGVFF